MTKVKSFLSRDPLRSAEKALRGGDSARAMESFARARQWRRAAQLAAELGDEEKLIRYCAMAALGQVPQGKPLDLLGMAERLAAQGHHEEAILLFERAGASLQAAESARAARDPQRAARYFKQAGAWLQAVQCLEEDGKLREALQTAEEGCLSLERALGGKERVEELSLVRADLLLRMSRGEAAVRLLGPLPPSPRKAEILERAGRPAEAIHCYLELGLVEEASQLAERSPERERQQAQIFLRTGRPAEAGDLLARLGRTKEAAEAYEAAGDWGRAAYRWEAGSDPLRAAQAYEKAGRTRDAARCYEAAGMPRKAEEVSTRSPAPAASAPRQANRMLENARRSLATGDKSGAASLLLQMRPEEEGFGTGALLLAPLLIEEGFGQEAINRLHQVPRETARSIEMDIEYWIGRSHEAMGQRETAIACYERVAARSPEHRDASQRLAELRNPAPPSAPRPAELANVPTVGFPVVGGRLTGRYEILAELGRGGMGRVFKARDLELGEIVAIKTLLAPDEGFGEESRLLREVQICRRISHPNVVRVYDIGRFQGGLFVTMEYIEGKTLETVIEQETPLSFARIRDLLSEISAGLREAHTQGIVHRDLKPVNVMVTESRLKILDFGIASMASLESRLTQPGLVIGTPMYMAPDQLRGQEPDGRSDLYSLGLLAYALIAGRDPYDLADPTVLALKQLRENPVDVRTYRSETPEPWVALLDRLVAKDPEDRFQSAQEVLEALAALPV